MFRELIWVKENSLTEEFCKSVIDKFETDPYRQPGKVDQNNPRIDKDLKEFLPRDISLQRMEKDGWKLHPAHNYQVKDTGYKVQKYEPNGYYHWHHDWCMHKGWSRTFTYIWYLNTVEEKDGGWTEFIDGTKIQPKCGSILFFPATWTYVHRGYTTKVPKYLCNGWIYAKP